MQRKKTKHRLKIFLLSVFIVALLIMGLFQVLQEKLIFLPSKLDISYQYAFAEPFEELFLTTDDGAKLNGLYFRAENPKGIIVYFHGNAGDLSRWGAIVKDYTKHNWDVLVMDYRTFGKSTGELSESALFSDAQLFYDYAKKEFDESHIVVFGRSLGCAMATKVASQNNPSQLILETPFYNLNDIAKGRFPFLPTEKMLKYKFENNKNIIKVSCPVTIFQGTDDDIVPYDSAKRLFHLINGKNNNRFITIDGGEHNNLIEFEKYRQKLNNLLALENNLPEDKVDFTPYNQTQY